MVRKSTSSRSIVWRQIHWPQPLDASTAAGVLRSLAADQHSPHLIFEVRATTEGVSYLLGGPLAGVLSAQRVLKTALPGIALTGLSSDRQTALTARRLRLTTRHRPLRLDAPDHVSRSVLGALTTVAKDEQLVLQLILGPRRIPLAVPNNSPSSVVMPVWQIAWLGNGGRIDGDKRTALRTKVSDHGFASTIRLGVTASNANRRRDLLIALYSALRVSEAPGVSLRLRAEASHLMNTAHSPWRWPLRLSVPEVLALSGWPVGDEPLPGQPAAHPKMLAPAAGTTGSDRIVADAMAPGHTGQLALPATNALHHTHVIGPTGTGKSTLLLNLITQDIQAGRAVVVVDPQGDLIARVLERVPKHRYGDVVVLDPADRSAPVGLNPLLTRGRDPEIVADGVLAVFTGLYGDSLGPRSQDILHSCLLTLTRRGDASLVMLPLLLTNAGFRRSLTANLRDPIALGPFWDWYEHLSEGERQAAIAPIQNKLRQWLLRPSLRNVLGQRTPKLTVSEVFGDKKIMLVSLAQGQLGPEGAALLGSLITAELWQATTERSRLPPASRHPVMVYLDEFSAFMHLPTDLSDALARSRGMGVAYTLAHQFMAQLSPSMRSAVMANTRSRICFQLAPEDATLITRSHPELVAEDLTTLGRYEVYASLFAGGASTPFASGRTLQPTAPTSPANKLRQLSRECYGQPLNEIEAGFADLASTRVVDESQQIAPGRARRRSV